MKTGQIEQPCVELCVAIHTDENRNQQLKKNSLNLASEDLNKVALNMTRKHSDSVDAEEQTLLENKANETCEANVIQTNGDNASLGSSDSGFVEIPLVQGTCTDDCMEAERKNNSERVSSSSSSAPSLASFTEEHCVIDITQIAFNSYGRDIENNIEKEKITSPTKTYDSASLCEPCCRVCQCSEDDEKLISPCHCSGSVKWVHESCLVKWMKSSFKDSCELCRKQINIMKKRKPFSKWKMPSQRPTPVLWVVVFVTAIALNLASVVKDASRLCSSTPCLVFYAVGCIGVVLGTLFLIYWSKRARNFINHWVELNEEWVVVLGNQQKRLELVDGPTFKEAQLTHTTI